MERKFLEDLGIAADLVDKIIDEHGKNINALKAQRDTYKSQLDTTKAELKKFDGINVEDLRGQITKLQTDLSAKEKEVAERISDIEFNSALEKAIKAAGGRNAKAITALIGDTKSLKASKNQEADIKAALEAVKKDNDYLFESVKPPYVVSSTSGAGRSNPDDKKAQANAALRMLITGKEA